jgi:hypothetical protein
MEGGKKGLLQSSTNICKGIHKATAEFDGQNGKAADLSPVLKNGQCGKAKKKDKRGGPCGWAAWGEVGEGRASSTMRERQPGLRSARNPWH